MLSHSPDTNSSPLQTVYDTLTKLKEFMVSGAVGLLSFDASELLLIASHRCLVTLGEHYLGPDGILFHLPEIEIHLR